MSKRTWIILGGMLLFFAASVVILRLYQTDLIQVAVINAMVQKAPQGEEQRIRGAFAQARRQARQEDRSDDYLKALMAISQRLEKTQEIDSRELEELLQLLDEPH